MPEITISQPFNYRSGSSVTHYKSGKQTVSPAVAAHAIAHGFAEPRRTVKRRAAPKPVAPGDPIK